MSPIQSILLHVDASPRCAERLKMAQQLAEPHRASVTAMFAELPASMRYPYTFTVGPEVYSVMQQYEANRLESARALFAKSPLSSQAVSQWLQSHGDPVRELVRQSWASDLVVLGQKEPEGDERPDLPNNWVESVLVLSGKPCLIVPYSGVTRLPGRNVLVAWKESKESARALAAAIPFLQTADKVHVATWNAEAGSEVREPVSMVQLERFLKHHDVFPMFHQHTHGTSRLGEQLLSLAADLDVDLIVMGAYGHSRAREWVLGGVTRTMLESMTVPLLMAH
jgi:nucleotide-binding universal stress UspA family protein